MYVHGFRADQLVLDKQLGLLPGENYFSCLQHIFLAHSYLFVVQSPKDLPTSLISMFTGVVLVQVFFRHSHCWYILGEDSTSILVDTISWQFSWISGSYNHSNPLPWYLWNFMCTYPYIQLLITIKETCLAKVETIVENLNGSKMHRTTDCGLPSSSG